MPVAFLAFFYQAECLQQQQQRLHRVSLPLVGGPAWLKLHEAAVFEVSTHAAFNHRASRRTTPSCSTLPLPLPLPPPLTLYHDRYEQESDGQLLLLDFLPSEPQAPQTLAALISLQSVEGSVRRKPLTRFPRVGVVTSSVPISCDTQALATELETSFDRRLRLPSNNCRTFVKAVVDEAARATAAAEAAGAGAGDGGGEGGAAQQPPPKAAGPGSGSREVQGGIFGLQTPVPTNAAEYAAQYAALLMLATAAAAGSGAYFLHL